MTRLEQLEQLAHDTNALIKFMGRNTGSTADWPMHIICDGDTLKGFCERINKVSKELKDLGFIQIDPNLAP